MTMRKVRAFRVSVEFLIDMCKPGERHFECMSGLPLDAELESVRCSRDSAGVIEIIVKSETFGPIEFAAAEAAVPLMDPPVFRKITK
jgi:hypothetical protein